MTQERLNKVFEEYIKPYVLKRVKEAEQEMLKRVVGEMKEYPKKLFELNNGKMPWVIFQGKADEGEKFTLYKLGFEDAMNLLSSLDKEINNNKE